MVLQVSKPQIGRGECLVEVLHQLRFGHGRQLVEGSIMQSGVMAPVELRAGVGRGAQFLQGVVLVRGDPGGVPFVPSPPCGPQKEHPGDDADVHGGGLPVPCRGQRPGLPRGGCLGCLRTGQLEPLEQEGVDGDQ